MKKLILLLAFLVYQFAAYAQPQAGDYTFGFSSLGFNSIKSEPATFNFNNRSFSANLSVGKFLTDNYLFGGNFSIVNQSLFTPLIESSVSVSPALRFGVFNRYYIGNGILRGITEARLDVSLNDPFNNPQIFSQNFNSILLDFGVGAAFFVTDYASIDLVYNVNAISFDNRDGAQAFARKISPNINLGLNFFFLKDREGVENLSSINSITKGTIVASANGSLLSHTNIFSANLDLGLDYFIRDRAYLGINTGLFNSTFDNSFFFNFKSASFRNSLNGGVYLPLKEGFMAKLTGEVSMQNQRTRIEGDVSINTDVKLSVTGAGLGGGLAYFWNRHKIEGLYALRFETYSLSSSSVSDESVKNVSLAIDHEWFLTENFSLNSIYIIRPSNTSFSPFNSVNGSTLTEANFSTTQIRTGFKWYL